jgi:hypothetical protein
MGSSWLATWRKFHPSPPVQMDCWLFVWFLQLASCFACSRSNTARLGTKANEQRLAPFLWMLLARAGDGKIGWLPGLPSVCLQPALSSASSQATAISHNLQPGQQAKQSWRHPRLSLLPAGCLGGGRLPPAARRPDGWGTAAQAGRLPDYYYCWLKVAGCCLVSSLSQVTAANLTNADSQSSPLLVATLLCCWDIRVASSISA